MPDILIVDDEENVAYALQLALQRAGHQCRVAHSLGHGWEAAQQRHPDAALVDLQLPDGTGIDLIGRLRESGIEAPVIVITAFGTVARAVEAMKSGAVDFLQKPLAMEEVALTVGRCLEHGRMRRQLEAYREAQRLDVGGAQLIGACARIRAAIEAAERVATIPADPSAGLTVALMLGETGTGKELLARHLHARGPKADGPFVHVNSTTIPDALFESELFGHERGTFTDARDAKKGLVEIAHEGTLFLDEIGDLPSGAQAKLLVVIESGRFRRLGSTRERVVSARVIAATNADLKARVEQGQFRADLYYRLMQFPIELPPLRERGDDLLLLAEFFLERAARKFHKPVPTLTPSAASAMRGYPWPGNVRELAHVLQRSLLLSDDREWTGATLGLPAAGGAKANRTAGPVKLELDFTSGAITLDDAQRRVIEAALSHCRGSVSEAARVLGMTRGGLRHRIERLGILPSDPGGTGISG